ncbi:hypothetical protein K503DRAFT_805473 [Rhizopogon vinicolor AM-OR11-026]|uniref:Uncharacterized protein n=1 Tax=Rhizopogon vinicolor AM-OR11-026 TaxID=1314800 RepID=A0A1B7MHR2_9AGAM|nr:hypothetical protein K503DRAFT_805473 [Rhizopogon vinicolor AM-OR11-026]
MSYLSKTVSATGSSEYPSSARQLGPSASWHTFCKFSFQSCSLDDLIDIADALQVPTSRTKRGLSNVIREHFELHLELKDDVRFSGLFTGRSRSQKRSFNEGPSDENDQNAPPATRPCLEIIPFHSAAAPSPGGPPSTPRNILATSSSHNAFEPI